LSAEKVWERIGTNDLNTNFEVPTVPDRLPDLIDEIFAQDPDALLVLTQIVPSRNDRLNQLVEACNGAHPAIVEDNVALGCPVILVDMYGTFTANGNYKNELLADVMGEVFCEALAGYLP
jgi:hypothetical protein